MKIGPRAKLEIAQVGQVDARTQDVAGEHVGRELQPRELAVEALGDRLGQQRFADARRVLDQQVPFGQQGDDRQSNRIRLSQKNAGNTSLERLDQTVFVGHACLPDVL